ncbi:MAG: hypothetical protein GVY15_13325 [Bacteroidetes bacterium]|jgi:hypothetical protein|nr:hypothetical protein [Bacteroidota bacterium]
MRLLLVLLLMACAVGVPRASAQDLAPVRGVTWAVPADPSAAAAELEAIAATGATAVHTGIVTNTQLLAQADTLGLVFYQQVPLRGLSARQLRGQVGAVVEDVVPGVRERAAAHPSARYIGLAHTVDTGAQATCAALQPLVQALRAPGAAAADLTLFYTTALLEGDRCHPLVDHVLLDARAAAPGLRLARWQAAHETPGGVVIGYARAPGQPSGTAADEAQAHMLEAALRTVAARPHAAVFVHRWHDLAAQAQQTVGGLLPRHVGRAGPQGLHTADGTARSALRVVTGFFTGQQRVFAFDPPLSERSGVPYALIVAVWVLLGALGVVYRFSLAFRQLLARYFFTPRFFYESVREGRELGADVYGVALALMACSAGLLAAALAVMLASPLASAVALRWGVWAGSDAAALLQQPVAVGAVAAAGSTLSALLWSGVLWGLGQEGRPLRAPQALTLVVWPRWAVGVLFGASLVVLTLPAPGRRYGLLALVGLWAVAWLLRTARTLQSFLQITTLTPRRLGLAFLLSPLLPAVVLLALGLYYRTELLFLVRLVLEGPF